MQSRYVSKSINQKDIAERLGVSVMTVSRALRNHPDLSEATKQRIIAKAVELGYSKIPSRTQSASVKRIGLYCCQEPVNFSFFNSGVIKKIFMAVEQECKKRKIELVLQFLQPGDVPVAVANKTIDSAFLMGRYRIDTAEYFKDIAAIALSNFIKEDSLPSIVSNNMGGGRQLTRHLLDLGHEKIVFVDSEEPLPTEIYRQRADGYAIEMMDHGLKPVIFQLGKQKSWDDLMPEILKATAVVGCNDGIAEGVINHAKKSGLRIPEDLSVVGYDNTEGTEALGLTSYSPNWEQLGRSAVDLMVCLPKELLRPWFKLIVSGELVVRKSTAKPRSK